MNNIRFILLTCGLLLFLTKSFSKDYGQPNIIVILTDDQGYADAGFQGLPASFQVLTPNIDKLAQSGLIFKNGYVAVSTCSPSRASLLTGRSASRFGVEDNGRYADTTEIIIPRAIASQGYATGSFGKWHLGKCPGTTPLDRGFDFYYGDTEKGKDYFMKVVSDPPCWKDGTKSPGENGRYITDAYTDEAISFIDKNKDKPFFAYVAYNAPHSPFLTTRQLLERVVEARPEWAPVYERMKNETAKWNGDRYNFGPFKGEDLDQDVLRLTYISMLLAADDGVGKIIETLEQNNLREKTLIFYLSDNGAALNRPNDLGGVNLPLRHGKGSVYDGGVRVPYVMSWPGVIAPGIDSLRIVSSMDIFGTTVELAGASIPTDRVIDGVNLIPYLTGEKQGQPHEALFFRRKDRNAWSIRKGDYKWIYTTKTDEEPEGGGLYDIQNDISESVELSDSLIEIKNELSALFYELTKDLPEPKPIIGDGITNCGIPSTMPDTEPPSMVTNLHVSDTGSNSVTLLWNQATDNDGVMGYEIYLANNYLHATHDTFTVIDGLLPVTYYSFRVIAVDSSNNKSQIKSVNVTTKEEQDIVSTNALKYNNNNSIVSIFPNPTDDRIKIRLNCESGHASFKLLDISGRVHLTKLITSNYSELDISQLKLGVYIAEISLNNRIYRKKLIKSV